MPQVITLHVGQCGVQIANNLWSMMLHDMDIDKGGLATEYDTENHYDRNAMFFETTYGWTPRTLLIDSEPSVVEDLYMSSIGNLFDEESLIVGIDGASNCYTRGKLKVAMEIGEQIIVTVRRFVEKCDIVSALNIWHSIQGGTGSGLVTYMLDSFADMFYKKIQCANTNIPCPVQADSTTCAYNSILSIAEQQIGLRHVFDNVCLGREMSRCLGEANYFEMNHIVALLNSATTAEFWDPSSSGGSLVRERQNLVPFPELNTVVSAYVPLLSYGSRTLLTEEAFTSEAFASNHECATVNMQQGKYFACLMIYRGANTNPASNHRIVSEIRHGPYEFVDWIPSSFSMAYIKQPVNHGVFTQKITTPAKSLVKVSNHSEMIPHTISRINKDFDLLLSRRAFIDWYTREGLEEGELADASEAVKHMVETAVGLIPDVGSEAEDE